MSYSFNTKTQKYDININVLERAIIIQDGNNLTYLLGIESNEAYGLGINFSDRNGDLSFWSKQGVMLLNATLTVKQGLAGSHQNKGWESFTDRVIEIISEETNNTVFLLWGSFAKQKKKLINDKKHKILESGHPSPLSANRGLWFGNKHFSQCNEHLKKIGKKGIEWAL